MAGEGDAERLVVLLEARTNDALKAMDRAEKKFDSSYAGMRRGSKTATQQMEADMMRTTSRINQAVAASSTKIGSYGKSMLSGFVGGLVAGGITGIVSRLGQVASGVAAIGDEAKRAGLSIRSFQELKYVAEQNRVGVDALTDGIKELNLSADEFIVTGGGSAADAFKRLGYSAEELNTKLQDPSALFTEIIGKLQHLDRAAQIRIADELFGGTGGEQFVQLIEQGEEGIRRTIDEAHALGIVMDEQMIAKAAEVDRKFNQIANAIGSGVKTAIVSATGALLDFLKAQDEAIRRSQLMAMDADAQNRHRETIAEIEAFLDATSRVAPEAEAKVRNLVEAVITGQKEASEANDELRKMGAMDEEFFPIAASLTGLLSLLDQLVGRSATARQELSQLGDIDPVTTSGAPATWEGVQSVFFPKPTTKPGSGSKPTRNKEAEELERQQKAVQNLIAGLEFENSLIGLSALEQAKLTALRQAGAAATDKQKEKIAELVEQGYVEQQQIQYLTGLYDMLGQAGMTAINGIIDALDDGKITAEEFGSILGDVLRMAGQFFLNQAFGGIGSMFGFSEGGYTGPGGKHQPAGVVHKGEVVWSQSDIARAGGVGVVEAMRRGARRYADGGVVEPYRAAAAPIMAARSDSSASIAGGDLRIIIEKIEASSFEGGAAAANGFQEGMKRWQRSGEGHAFVRTVMGKSGRAN